ncbi:MAG: glycosyltransferase [Clostridia bacterium]|nr:glycosyltransferase [Clostridia bacterium]
MKNKKRPVLIVIGNNKNGGIAKHATMLANGFSDINKEAYIIVTKDQNEQSFFDLKENVSVVSTKNTTTNINKAAKRKIALRIKLLKIFSFFIPKKSKARRFLGFSVSKIRNSLSLKETLEQFSNPIIIALGLSYAIDVFYASIGIKCDMLYGTKTYAEGELGGLDTDIASILMKSFSGVVSQTNYTSDYFKKLGVSNIKVIGNPLALATPVYKGERNNRIVNFCRISKEKRLDLLIKAFSVFHNEFPDYCIDIYGNIVTQAEEEHRTELLNLIDTLDLTDCVKIHNARKDIHEVVKDAAMFISTSTFEGLSNTMIEAMALGLPCICTDCDGGGSREYIEDGINGLLIPKDDETALIEAMKKFANDRVFAEKCGQNATAVRERLEIKNIISQWQNAIDEYCS